MKREYLEAFTEINEIFKLMPKELINKIPKEFREMISEERDKRYLPNIKEPLEKCNLKNETIIILGLIYRDFLCNSDEKKKLQEKDARELKEIQVEIANEMREKYNPDNLFKNKTEKKSESIFNEETSMTVIQKERWYRKIFNMIKGLLARK